MINLAMKRIAEITASVNAESSEPAAENFDNSEKIYSTPIEIMAANKITDVECAIQISETIVHADVHSQASTEIINVNEMPDIVEYEFEISKTNIPAHEHLRISEEIMSVSEMVENVEYEIQLSESNVQSDLNSEIEIEAEDENNNDNSNSKIKQLSKENRMNGSVYQGYERSRTNQVTFGIERPNRKLGETCISEYCVKSKMRKCSQFSQKIRQHIFTEFWKMNWQQKQMYVCNLVKEVPKKRIYTESSSRRTTSRCYYLKATNGDILQVCQNMFLNTLGIKEKMMRIWLKKSLPHGLQINPVETSNNRKNKLIASEKFLNNEKRQSHMKQFFELYPKLESHYCRKDSKKIYLQTASDSKTALYNK